MQHPIAGFGCYSLHALRHTKERHIAPAPRALHRQLHLSLRGTFQ